MSNVTLNYFAYKTKENTCPECKETLMLPYYPYGFDEKGIIQCTKCDYSRYVKMVSSPKPQETK